MSTDHRNIVFKSTPFSSRLFNMINCAYFITSWPRVLVEGRPCVLNYCTQSPDYIPLKENIQKYAKKVSII